MAFDPSGDYPTPAALADRVLARLAAEHPAPEVVVEPTCGEGRFLAAARRRLGPGVRLVGYERNPEHAARARTALPGAEIHVADAFSVDWAAAATGWTGRVWVVGNPPWVTAAALGRGVHDQGPTRENPGLKGLDAMTGAANFDLSEWIWLRLAAALKGRDALLALLCKTQTARRTLGSVSPVGVYRIDARKQFGVAADAGLWVGRPGDPGPCPVFGSLEAQAPTARWRVEGGSVVAGERDADLLGVCEPPWRSGVKHDCARVFELRREAGQWRNGLGELVEIEAERIAPWMKASDVHRGSGPERGLVLSQRTLTEGLDALAEEAPRTLAYLERHGALLDGRKSSIWKRRPRGALFGIGPYSFAPWKVAVSALRSELHFRVVGPRRGSPVLLDDTSYFLSFSSEPEAREAAAALAHPRVRRFVEARAFGDAKRKITRRALQQLDLEAAKRCLTP